jgi:KipI family sensor histidine kinase inhibitor
MQPVPFIITMEKTSTFTLIIQNTKAWRIRQEDIDFFALAQSTTLRKYGSVIHHAMREIPTRCFRYGDDAWLVEFSEEISDSSWECSRSIRQQLQQDPPPYLTEATFSYTRVLLEFEQGRCPAVAPLFREMRLTMVESETKTIDVCYDGEDLERVARHCGMTVADVIRWHSQATYRVHCLGFAPGFPYLSGLPACLHTPRLDTPRIRIPAGAVGIGGGQTGIYPLTTAGGWNLIGRIQERLFDPKATREQCTLLKAGDLLQFRPVPSFDS